jgi:hypothetical protein
MLMSRINCLTSTGTFGRPPRRRDLHRQYKRKPARCQRITVSGLTIANTLSTSGQTIEPSNTISRAAGVIASATAPQDIQLVAKCRDLDFQRSRSEQSNQSAPISLQSSIMGKLDRSLLFTSRIRFARQGQVARGINATAFVALLVVFAD